MPSLSFLRVSTVEYLPTNTYTKTINGHEVTFNDVGYLKEGPAIVVMSDWGQGIHEFEIEMILLMEHYRVIAVCFRGHGVNRDPVPDFGYEEHARDVLGLLDWLGITQFVCLSSGQSSWAALDLAEMAGRRRMIGLFLLEFLMMPLSSRPQLMKTLAAMQSPQWRSAVLAYHRNSSETYRIQIVKEVHMGGTSQETWMLASRNIVKAYETWITPMHRMEAMNDPPLIHHMYGHLDSKAYESLHKEFAKKHPQWFSYRKKDCYGRMPHLEHPKNTCDDTIKLISKAMARKVPESGAVELPEQN